MASKIALTLSSTQALHNAALRQAKFKPAFTLLMVALGTSFLSAITMRKE